MTRLHAKYSQPEGSLRRRIAEGEPAAFADPSLWMELMVDPQALWWWDGCRDVLLDMVLELGKQAGGDVLVVAFEAAFGSPSRPDSVYAKSLDMLRRTSAPRYASKFAWKLASDLTSTFGDTPVRLLLKLVERLQAAGLGLSAEREEQLDVIARHCR